MPTIATGTSATLTIPPGYALNLDGGASGTVVAPGNRYLPLGNYQTVGPFGHQQTVVVSVDTGRGAQVYNLFRVGGTVPGLVPNVRNATDSIIIDQSAVPQSVTGTLTETTLASVVLPGGVMGPNGALRIQSLWSITNNANNKTMKVKLGTDAYMNVFLTANTTFNTLTVVRNRGAANSQVGFPAASSGGGLGSASTANMTGSIDTSINQLITLTGTLANVADTITLEGYTIEVLPG